MIRTFSRFAGILGASVGILSGLGLPAAYAADRALIIGIDQYPALPFTKQLAGSVVDAQNMAHFARDVWNFAPDQIQVLSDQAATRGAILAAFDEWLIAGTGPGDRVLFYFSGHGFHQPDQNGDEADGEDETLVPHDVSIINGSFANMIVDDEIEERLKRLNDRAVTVMIDSCYSGTMTRALFRESSAAEDGAAIIKSLDDILPSVNPRKSAQESAGTDFRSATEMRIQRKEGGLLPHLTHVVAWYAVSPSQLAQVDTVAKPRQSVFTRRFIEGIRERKADSNRNGTVTHAELLDYLRTEARQYCTRQPCRTGMTPALEAEPMIWGRDVITKKPELPPVSLTQVTDTLPSGGTANLAGDASNMVVTGPKLEILPGARVAVGSSVRFRVTSPHSGHLVVFMIDTEQKITQLFPNSFSEAAGVGSTVQANQPFTIPDRFFAFDLKASGPPGKGALIAVVTADKVPLTTALAVTRGGFIPIADPYSYLGGVARDLLRTWSEELASRPVRWSVGHMEYEVIP